MPHHQNKETKLVEEILFGNSQVKIVAGLNFCWMLCLQIQKEKQLEYESN
jgi:hypothetical protein